MKCECYGELKYTLHPAGETWVCDKCNKVLSGTDVMALCEKVHEKYMNVINTCGHMVFDMEQARGKDIDDCDDMLGALKILSDEYIEFIKLKKLTKTQFKRISLYLQDAVSIDGAHHKQWYLEQIARILKVELPEHDKGIPD